MTAQKGWLRADWYWEHRLTPIDTLTAITGRTADSLLNSFRRNGISHPAHRVQVELPDILYPRAVKPPRIGDCSACSYRVECAANSGPPRYGALLCEAVLDLPEERAQLAGAERVV